MDGSPSASSQSAKDLAINLSKDITKNITLWDERLSSEGAFNLSSNLDVNVSKKGAKTRRKRSSIHFAGSFGLFNKK